MNVFAAGQEAFFSSPKLLSRIWSSLSLLFNENWRGGGVDSAKVLRTEPKFDYSLVCNAEFERSVVRNANIFQHARR